MRVAIRILAAVVAAYAVTAGASALIAVALVLVTGASRSDALIAASLFGYLIYALLMLWCFAERSLAKVWLLLAAAAIATHGLAIWIEPTLPVVGAAP